MVFVLENQSCYQVRIPDAIAARLFSTLAVADDMARMVCSDDDSNDEDMNRDANSTRTPHNNTNEEDTNKDALHAPHNTHESQHHSIHISNSNNISTSSRDSNSSIHAAMNIIMHESNAPVHSLAARNSGEVGTKRHGAADTSAPQTPSDLFAGQLDYSDATLDALAWYACLPDEKRTACIQAPSPPRSLSWCRHMKWRCFVGQRRRATWLTCSMQRRFSVLGSSCSCAVPTAVSVLWRLRRRRRRLCRARVIFASCCVWRTRGPRRKWSIFVWRWSTSRACVLMHTDCKLGLLYYIHV